MDRVTQESLPHSFHWCGPFPAFRRQIEAIARHQKEVIRVCTIYPRRVDYSSMEKALMRLNLNPVWVYLKLAEGARIAELDEALQEVASPW
jgi:hypothetical protein